MPSFTSLLESCASSLCSWLVYFPLGWMNGSSVSLQLRTSQMRPRALFPHLLQMSCTSTFARSPPTRGYQCTFLTVASFQILSANSIHLYAGHTASDAVKQSGVYEMAKGTWSTTCSLELDHSDWVWFMQCLGGRRPKQRERSMSSRWRLDFRVLCCTCLSLCMAPILPCY